MDVTRRTEILDMIQNLSSYWFANPELRLGQIIGNSTPAEFNNDPYYVPDEFYLTLLKHVNKERTEAAL